MTDLETYRYWADTYHALDTRRLRGDLSNDDFDRIVRNMEERLGVDRWSIPRWEAAFQAWNAELGA